MKGWMMRLRYFSVLGSLGLAGVAVIPLLGCDRLSNDVLRQLNPCLTVLNCDPFAYEDQFIDLFGGPRLNIDPTCTIPRRCGTFGFPGPGTGSAQAQGATNTGGGVGGGLGGGGLGGLGGGLGGGGFGGGFGT